jgi:formate hydrogenlyase subunit 6/NADH:ubiquinone oxidoreductase subunit I
VTDSYTILASKYGYADSDRFKSILKLLMNEDEADIVASLPADVEELAKKRNRPVAEIDQILARLYKEGVLFETRKGFQIARGVVQFHDATCSDRRSDEIYGRKLLDAWADFGEEEWYLDCVKEVKSLPFFPSRVIPARGTIAEGTNILPAEDINSLIGNAWKYAVVPCSCRRVHEKCKRPVDVCLQLNKAAEYAIKRGTGNELNKKETLELFDMAAREGLVHTMPTIAILSTIICNCCPDCCVGVYPHKKYGEEKTSFDKSRFAAQVDQESCSGCQDCVDICPFEAIEMTQSPGSKKLKAAVNRDKCYGCGVCAVSCLTSSIKLIEVRPPEYIQEY